jgi:hypothetical protein
MFAKGSKGSRNSRVFSLEARKIQRLGNNNAKLSCLLPSKNYRGLQQPIKTEDPAIPATFATRSGI